MLSSKPKRPLPGSCATTPNATQSGVYYAEGSSTSLKKKVRKTIKKQDKAVFRPIAAAISAVDYNLNRLKDLRLEEKDNALYIPPQAKPSLQSSDDTLFPLMEKVFEFLAGPGLVFLLLGDSGGGKSTFNLQLERNLWRTYKRGGPIPLHVNLPSIDDPQQDIIGKQLRQLDFPDNQIMELKQNRQCILICDGYDEGQLTTNVFNQPGQWNVKMIVTCRTQYLGSNYHNRFVPQGSSPYDPPALDLLQEAVIAPFTKEQIQRYVDIYFPLEPRIWCTQDYMDRLTTIPNLLDLVKNPFLLSLALEALPGVTKGKETLSTIKISRVQLYDTFVRHWLEVNQRRLEGNKALSKEDRDMLNHLVDDDFIACGINYSEKLSAAIFEEQDGNPIVQYSRRQDKNSWKAAFFSNDSEVKLLRESNLLTRTGNQFRFVHRSMLEYFFSRVIYNPARTDNQECDPQTDTVSSAATLIDANGPLFRRNLLQESSIIQFLCDRVKTNPDFEQELPRVVDLTKTDSSAATAATNSITILVRAGVLLNGADLRGVKIPGADLSDGQFDSVQLQGADLTDVILSRSWLRQVDLSGARLEGVRFGELPYLYTSSAVKTCTYSPNGRMLAVTSSYMGFSIYDTSTWTVISRLTTDKWVVDIAFSPDSQKIVMSGWDGVLHTWDCTSGEELLAMSGYTKAVLVLSVVFSPCGKHIASASKDGTVRLWDSETGERLFVLEGHTQSVLSVKYSPDGCQLVSGSDDETIRFWNPQTGKPGAVLSPSLGVVLCLAYSPGGRWIATGHEKGALQLWNAATRECGLILRGHSDSVTGIAFCSSGQWIASSSDDLSVRLWDASTGTILSVWTGHGSSVKCVAFSPDGLHVASGGWDKKVRLWEVGSRPPSLDPRDGIRMYQIAYASDGRTILAQSLSQVFLFRKWDAVTGASSEPIPLDFAEPKAVSCTASSQDHSQVAVGYTNGSIHLWNGQTAGPILKGHSSMVILLVYSPCCRWIASSDDNKTVRLWNLHNKEQHCALGGLCENNEEIRALVFSSTGDKLAFGGNYGSVRHFDLLPMERLICKDLASSPVVSMVYSPNGRQIAIGSASGYIHLLDLQSKQPGARLSGHSGRVECIAYSPCGQWIASGCGDYTVGIWHLQLLGEVESWSRVHSICSFFGSVKNIEWNPVVPMELVTNCWDGSIRVWRLSSDECRNISVKMLWGSNLGILCVDGLALGNVTGLSSINKKLLVQRGAVSNITNHEEQK